MVELELAKCDDVAGIENVGPERSTGLTLAVSFFSRPLPNVILLLITSSPIIHEMKYIRADAVRIDVGTIRSVRPVDRDSQRIKEHNT